MLFKMAEKFTKPHDLLQFSWIYLASIDCLVCTIRLYTVLRNFCIFYIEICEFLLGVDPPPPVWWLRSESKHKTLDLYNTCVRTGIHGIRKSQDLMEFSLNAQTVFCYFIQLLSSALVETLYSGYCDPIALIICWLNLRRAWICFCKNGGVCQHEWRSSSGSVRNSHRWLSSTVRENQPIEPSQTERYHR